MKNEGCFHYLTTKDVPKGYRYFCLKCGKLLKIKSGILVQSERGGTSSFPYTPSTVRP